MKYDFNLLAPLLLLVITLLVGGVAIWLTFRWYRDQKKESSTAQDALAELARNVQQSDDLDPEEIKRIQAAIRRRSDEPR